MHKRMCLAVCCLTAMAVWGAEDLRIQHDAVKPVQAGDVITVRAWGAINRNLNFSFGDAVVNQALQEVAPGAYRGEYTVRRGQQLNGLPVIVRCPEAGRNGVWQASSPVGTPPRRDAARLAVTGVSVSPKTWVHAGDELSFVVTATPGCRATISMTGGIRDITLQETAPGRYTGVWRVATETKLDTNRCLVLCKLRFEEHEVIGVSSDVVALDTQRPLIVDVTPSADSTTSQHPQGIAAVLTDAGGSGLVLATARLSVDGQPVATGTPLGPDAIVSWQPAAPLAPGVHEAKVEVDDVAGNRSVYAWRFNCARTLIAPPPPPLPPVHHQLVPPTFTFPTEGAQVGENAVFKGRAKPGSQVRLSIQAKVDVAFVDASRQLPDVLVVADADGNWTTPPVFMRKASELFETVYTVSATASEGDRQAGPTVLKVRRP